MSDEQNGETVKTVPPDARYHNCNASKWCYATFLDYHRCCRLLGEGNPTCDEFQKIYKTICPNDWIKKWEDQIEQDIFPGHLPSKECK